jgi:hypothetical protein
MGYSPPWYVHLLLDAAGAQWPHLDEDAYSDFALVLNSAAGEMLSESGYVSGQLLDLQSQISADTFTALHQRWETAAHPAIKTIAHDMQNVAQLLFDIAQLIIKLKEAVIVYAGLVDLGEDLAILGSLGTGAAAARAAAGRAVEAEIQRQLVHLEHEVLNRILDGKTIRGWEEDIATAASNALTQGMINLVSQ